jgi:hypothetical protein
VARLPHVRAVYASRSSEGRLMHILGFRVAILYCGSCLTLLQCMQQEQALQLTAADWLLGRQQLHLPYMLGADAASSQQ